MLFYGFPPGPQVQDGWGRSGGTPECCTEDAPRCWQNEDKVQLMLSTLSHDTLTWGKEFIANPGSEKPPPQDNTPYSH